MPEGKTVGWSALLGATTLERIVLSRSQFCFCGFHIFEALLHEDCGKQMSPRVARDYTAIR